LDFVFSDQGLTVLASRKFGLARLIRQEALNRVMGKTVVKNSSGNTVSSLVP
jgi:hypothetical protein